MNDKTLALVRSLATLSQEFASAQLDDFTEATKDIQGCEMCGALVQAHQLCGGCKAWAREDVIDVILNRDFED